LWILVVEKLTRVRVGRLLNFSDDLVFENLLYFHTAFFRFRFEQHGVDLQIQLPFARFDDLAFQCLDACVSGGIQIFGSDLHTVDDRKHFGQWCVLRRRSYYAYKNEKEGFDHEFSPFWN
jgi:hypothetical protein